jgi:sensor histidine kinase YesM
LVELQAIDEPDAIRISVADDGVGLEQDTVQPGIGLRNVADRLHVFYDGAAHFSIAAREGGGARATVTIPKERV